MSSSELRTFTSESVTEGHPDKICDQISDAILDDMLAQDRGARVAVETMVTTGLVHVAGEVRTKGYSDVARIVRDVIREIGYDSSEKGFDADSCGIEVSIGSQSDDISAGVETSFESRGGSDEAYARLGAGDQGLMFGYACDDTPELMPLPIHAAHTLTRNLSRARRDGVLPYLRPDGKTQVSIGYDEQGVARSVEAIVVSSQHAEEIDLDTQLAPALHKVVIAPVLEELGALGLDIADVTTHINPSGRFVIGGPKGDAGLTGRKIIVDTYGGMARHGGGAFSGKDPSKVDRSGAYAMRWVAKNIVAAGLAKRCEVQVAYAIGVAEPMGLYVETFGTGVRPDHQIAAAVRKVFDLRPAALIDALDLLRPIYRLTSTGGHFGRKLPEFTWEQADRVEELERAL
ncbi:S-adenosylmethionine synthetase [Brachybacterium muris]|uniref:S-adenosylmethionine synthase n=1 Tax=Brachybacterium muris UCD-AY4 TaxID=1249481 RepID=A0A022KYW7_9MICO|nr:methionine adenosyltransferase [Brachybacterium muris]EYT48477.1 S-adenosylmethionine synthetase [Brachybacterium muris UCD-AY4]MBM7500529.1 S-adenosylmethionine synthetase [Brachybacterium muris]MCT1430663.1 methionine adenosyltransferase [Brachybacterium muris]MCT1654713.1 methionine adenosyltransferase [Brachybacterium muris]MCT2177759.1 methionine adenosyltransferase [Brachybacterium muris]